MKLLLRLSLLFLALLSCKKQTKTDFLQQNSVHLAQPRVSTNKTFIDSFVTVKANLKVNNVTIHYTFNSEEPDLNSTKYTQPIKVFKPGIYKFKAFHNDWKSSEITSLELFKKGIVADTILWQTNASEKYSGQGTETVINQTKASLNFTDIEWVGFDTTAIATVKFPENTFVKTVTISYLNDAASWIFPPESVTIFINDAKIELPIEIEQIYNRKNETVSIPIEAMVKSLKIQINNLKTIPNWHEGKGQKAWLFLDEFIFN